MKIKEAPGEIIDMRPEGKDPWYVRGGPDITAEIACQEVAAYLEEDGDDEDGEDLIADPCSFRWLKLKEGENDGEFEEDATHWFRSISGWKPGYCRGWAVYRRSTLAAILRREIVEQRIKAAIMASFPEATMVDANPYLPSWRVSFQLPEMKYQVDYHHSKEKPYMLSWDDLDAWNRLYTGRPLPTVEIPTDEEVMG